MVKRFLGSHLLSLLLDPAPGGAVGGAAGGGAAVVAAVPAAGAPAEAAVNEMDFQDAAELLGVPQELTDRLKSTPAAAQKPEARSQKLEAKTAVPEAGAPGAAAGAPKPAAVEFSAEQKAWLAERAGATTPETIAAIEAKVPEFTPEQTAWLEDPANAEKLTPENPESRSQETEAIPQFTTPEQKAFVEKQTAAMAAKETELTQATAKITALEQQVEALKTAPAPMAGNVHPVLLAATEADIDGYEGQLEKQREWCRKNWDGATLAATDKEAAQTFTAEQVRNADAKIDAELRRVVPAARELLAQRGQHAAAARQLYPELFDAKQPEAQNIEGLLRKYPVLRVIFPNFHIIAGDAMRGEKARMAEAAAKDKPKAKALTLPKGLKIPPRPGSGGRSAVSAPAKPAAGVDVAKFKELTTANGGDEVAGLAKLFT